MLPESMFNLNAKIEKLEAIKQATINLIRFSGEDAIVQYLRGYLISLIIEAEIVPQFCFLTAHGQYKVFADYSSIRIEHNYLDESQIGVVHNFTNTNPIKEVVV